MGLINVKDLIQKYRIEELLKAADDYFVHADHTALLRKPFNDLTEAPEVLLTFLLVAQGLALPPGSTILDFGAGSCWSSRFLADLGYHVIAADVSEAALDLGRAAAGRAYPRPERDVEFLLFDGLRLNLPDESVDGVMCLSAFHHVPNPDVIIREFARVLKPWGVAGLSEPGPQHSWTPQSQLEMQHFGVIENDVDLDSIWDVGREAGFTDLEISVFYPGLSLMTYPQFKGFLNNGDATAFTNSTRLLMQERRLFFLEKGLPQVTTSAQASGLNATVVLSSESSVVKGGQPISLIANVKNIGTGLWRPSDWSLGPVRLGGSLMKDGQLLAHLPRSLLDTQRRNGVLPGQTIVIPVSFSAPLEVGEYEVKFQLVSEFVAWFGGEATFRLTVTE